MLRSQGIESVLRRELDSLPLPPQEQWVPSGTRHGAWSTATWVVAGAVLIGLALLAGPALREWRTEQESSAARPTPLVLPTVIGGIGVSPLRNVVRNTELGYNLVLPANWRESARGQLQSPPTLIGRATYTARSPEQEGAPQTGIDPLPTGPWDVTAALWSSNGLNALQWAQRDDGCAARCTFGNTQINGVTFLTTVDSARGVHAFYVERGSRVLVFSYVVGTNAEQPAGVTADTLEQIVRSVGLP